MSENNLNPLEEFKSSEQVAKELAKLGFDIGESKVDLKEAKEEEIKKLDVQAEVEKEKLRRLQDENDARKWLREPLLAITVAWMFLVLMFVGCCGIGKMHLSDTVLVTLITTTTANVFGFLYVVVNYLFNKDKSS